MSNSNENDIDNGASPRWWLFIRRVIIFFLGVAVIVDALIEEDAVTGKLIVGVIMIGVLPLDDLAVLIPRRPSLRRDRSSV